jgi:tRNA pseudouridine38-40 synthase
MRLALQLARWLLKPMRLRAQLPPRRPLPALLSERPFQMQAPRMQAPRMQTASPESASSTMPVAEVTAEEAAAVVVGAAEVDRAVAATTSGRTPVGRRAGRFPLLPNCFSGKHPSQCELTTARRRNQGDDKRSNDWHKRKRMKVDESGHRVATAEGDGSSYMSIQFSKDEIDAEERKPKRKVAVMIGYAGTGYHGMQINHKEKTIEGDLFGAFVAAQAISKVNADDPRKSSLVRCARTDKGVHAAGNVISLKLIIEDPDIVQKINDALPPQIRVWGIQRTNNAFSSYATCDSRWYEYLMPSYCLLPPHPESFIGKKVLEAVKEKGVEEEYKKRMADVEGFWESVEKNDIQPIIDSLDLRVREEVLRRRHTIETETKDAPESTEKETATEKAAPSTEPAAAAEPTKGKDAVMTDAPTTTAPKTTESEAPVQKPPKQPHPVDSALKKIKAAYIAAKRRYRVTPERLSQLQEALDQYVGTKNFHNYTIQKSPKDPSSKRNIKSFVANPEPVQINDTQWLSLKVHGQSFMMHQIRKMVGMAVLVTRCATDLERITQSYEPERISIPKAPGLGLLLERPVFTNYNNRARENYDRPEIDFGNYEKEIQEFKDKHIYRRIFELEEKENSYVLPD